MKKLLVGVFVLLVIALSPTIVKAVGDDAVITVTWNADSTSVIVTSTKDISNVVLEDCAGVRYKHDNLNGLVGNFEHPSGEAILYVWVKSGNNDSGDGPGYGKKFTNPNETVCDEEETTTTTLPEVTTTTLPETTTSTAPVTATTLPAPEVTPSDAVNNGTLRELPRTS